MHPTNHASKPWQHTPPDWLFSCIKWHLYKKKQSPVWAFAVRKRNQHEDMHLSTLQAWLLFILEFCFYSELCLWKNNEWWIWTKWQISVLTKIHTLLPFYLILTRGLIITVEKNLRGILGWRMLFKVVFRCMFY